MIDEEIPAALDGERLDRIVAIITGSSRADASVLVAAGGAQVEGEVVVSGKVRLHQGQHVSVDPRLLPQLPVPQPDPSIEFTVVYADDDVIVIDKPAGLVVHPGAGNPDGTRVNGLLARFPEIADVGEFGRPGIVHRLDVGTTGLMIVARSSVAYDYFVQALSVRAVERGYRTLVWGWPSNVIGVIDAPIGRDHRDPMRMAVVADGKAARTRYRVERTYRDVVDVAELACRLETGRTHQIRVHLAAIGHPVVGDPTYGGGRSGVSSPRPMLHAEALAFEHPVSGERLSFHAEIPDDMAAVIVSLGAPQVADAD